MTGHRRTARHLVIMDGKAVYSYSYNKRFKRVTCYYNGRAVDAIEDVESVDYAYHCFKYWVKFVTRKDYKKGIK